MPMRDLLLFFMRADDRKAAEAESRQWLATCPNCRQATSIWDLGGIRYRAKGRPVMNIRCPHCGQRGAFHVAREKPAA